MKPTNNKLYIFAFSLALCLAFSGCESRDVAASSFPAAFSIESGPDEIGSSRVWVIRHKQSGQRFIYTERRPGGILMVPL